MHNIFKMYFCTKVSACITLFRYMHICKHSVLDQFLIHSRKFSDITLWYFFSNVMCDECVLVSVTFVFFIFIDIQILSLQLQISIMIKNFYQQLLYIYFLIHVLALFNLSYHFNIILKRFLFHKMFHNWNKLKFILLKDTKKWNHWLW